MIDQLVSLVCSRLGVSQDIAEQAVGVAMSFFEKKGDSGAVTDLFAAIPGASDLASRYQGVLDGSDPGAGGGMLGGLMNSLGGAMGGKAGNAMEALGAFQKTGLTLDQARDMLPVVKSFIADQAGEDTMKRAFESVPAFKALMP